jgi:type III secretory pathway component EscV
MGLRDPGPASLGPVKLKSYNLPQAVRVYLEEAASSSGRTQTQVVIEAILLDQALETGLADIREQMKRIAAENGLHLSSERGKVLLMLVREAVQAREAARADTSKRPSKK